MYQRLLICLFFFTLYLLFFSSVQAASMNESVGAVDVIIDTDAGSDDMIAISYLLKQKQLKVLAIMVDTNGLSMPEKAAAHIGGLLKLMHQEKIPVYVPKQRQLHPTADQIPLKTKVYMENAFFSYLSVPQCMIGQKKLAELFLRNGAAITVLGLGSATNLADLFQKYPSVKRKIKRIVYMGGALFVPGNISSLLPDSLNTLAEWNIYFDPEAFSVLLASKIPITLLPLDLTNHAVLAPSFLSALEKRKNNALAQYWFTLLQPEKTDIQNHLYDYWDPAAAVLLVHPMPVKDIPIHVQTKKGSTYAATQANDFRSSSMLVAIPKQLPRNIPERLLSILDQR